MKKWTALLVLILVGVLVAVVYAPGQQPGPGENKNGTVEPRNPEGANPGPTDQPPRVILYFGRPDAAGVIPVRRPKPQEAEMIPFLVEQLKDDQGLGWIVPKEARLLSYRREGDLLVLDFSREFQTRAPGGTAGESIMIAGIANTFTELPYIKRVLILVEGKPLETGHNIYDEPLRRNEGRIISE